MNSLLFEETVKNSQNIPAIEVLFVAARKDFRTLELAINGVIESCHQEISRISIIVPDQDLTHCAVAVASCNHRQIEIVSESTVIDESLTKLIFSRFGTRGGWVLQQILKLEFVRKSKSEGVLIVDADTILIKKRTWLNSSGVQVLTPSWEYHKPYFDFLSALAPFKSLAHFFPKFSFVSHHMLMQPIFVNEIYHLCEWDSSEDLVHYLCEHSANDNESPFSIDYELYGQFMLHYHPEEVHLVKWSNISSRFADNFSPKKLTIVQSGFASISLHDYLD